MKRTAWLPLLTLLLATLVPVRADTDGRFLGKAIQFDGKRKPAALPPVAAP